MVIRPRVQSMPEINDTKTSKLRVNADVNHGVRRSVWKVTLKDVRVAKCADGRHGCGADWADQV